MTRRPLSISFEMDVSALAAEMPDWARNRIPSITRNALNDTVEDARVAETQKIGGVFDRPTPWIERSPRFTKATKDHLVAEVFIAGDVNKSGVSPIKVLAAQVSGGYRRPKRFEVALQRIGVMRADEYAVPAIGQQRDAYGNLPGRVIVQILSQLRAFSEVGFMANQTARSRGRNAKRATARYFVPSGRRQEQGIGRLPRGIYERRGSTIRAVVIFARRPNYRRRYEFGEATLAKAARVFPAYWQRHFFAEVAKRTSGHGLRRSQLG